MCGCGVVYMGGGVCVWVWCGVCGRRCVCVGVVYVGGGVGVVWCMWEVCVTECNVEE